jgi:hypothetical protein
MLPLSDDGILQYLLDRGLVTPRSVVNGKYLSIREVHRNRSNRIETPEGAYFVKQIDPDDGDWRRIEREAKFYWLAESFPPFVGLAGRLPKFINYDPARKILILSLVRDARSMRRARSLESGYATDVARAAAETMRAVHDISASGAGELKDILPAEVPPILSITEPATQGRVPRNAGTEYLLQQLRSFPAFGQMLNQLREGWTSSHLIHGDVKWANCLLVEDGMRGEQLLRHDPSEDRASVGSPATQDLARSSTPFLMVDWETAAWGDPAWDAGSLIHDYFRASILTAPIREGANADWLVAVAERTLRLAQPAIQVFWSTWAGATATPDLARRVAGYVGARLLQSIVETLISTGTVTPQIAALMQLSHNIASNPDDAAGTLLRLK